MPPESDYPRLFRRGAIALSIGFVLVVVCYFFIDRPVAFYVHNHGINKFAIFQWLTLPPPIVQRWSPLLMAALLVRRAFGPWRRVELALFVACISLIVADQCRLSLGDLCGRYWPETWRDNNPSLIGNGTYGFHAFQNMRELDDFLFGQDGDDAGSFPSGHAARIVGFLGVFWAAFPRGRWVCVLLGAPMALSLVAMNYHFVGDVTAGAVLGGIVAGYAAWAAELTKSL